MSQLSLLGAKEPTWEPFALPDADVRLLHSLLARKAGEALYETLRTTVPWRQDTIKFYGKEHPLPRLQQWFGDAGLTYTWSGIAMKPEQWTTDLLSIKSKVEEVARETFNTVLVNFYRNGNDTVSWHSDDEKALGPRPIIASVSLGAEREFVLRHKTRKDLAPVPILLTHGSVLLMSGDTQREWEHTLPRRKLIADGRINLTFRKIDSPKRVR
jgi:alkylated DNA repair dioxygenase AlkB